jgi:hypothetical protein
MNRSIDIDIFDEKYTMFTDSKSVEMCPESQVGMFETYGEDVQEVLKIANGDKPNRVWTAIDGDEGFWLVNGYRLVNRVYYMITNEEGGNDEDYLIDDFKCHSCGIDRMECNETYWSLKEGSEEHKQYKKEHGNEN